MAINDLGNPLAKAKHKVLKALGNPLQIKLLGKVLQKHKNKSKA